MLRGSLGSLLTGITPDSVTLGYLGIEPGWPRYRLSLPSVLFLLGSFTPVF